MTGNDCRRVQQLWLDEADGRALTADDRALLAEHRESCRFCRAEEAWLHAAGLDMETGPAPVLDDLASRRWVDDILDRAEEPAAETKIGARVFRYWAAAAAILLLIGSAGLVWVLQDPVAPAEPIAEETAPIAPTFDSAQLLLLSGGSATVDGAVPQVGDSLPAGARLTVDGGRAVLQLREGLRVCLEGGSISYQPAPADGVNVALDAGQLFILADPQRPGGPIDIRTRTGTVHITGTYLSVADGGDDIAVEVYRGSVQVTDEHNAARAVIGGQRHLIGSDELTPISDDTVQQAGRIQDLLQLLGRARYTTVEVRSIPEGATVSLDGCPMGPTPLTAHVVAGQHKLELEADRYVPSREFIQLEEGAREARTIELLALADFEGDPVPAPPVIAQAPPVADVDPALAAQLLQQARAQRTDRAWSDAAATYRQLTDEFPDTPEARSSWVSLGTIQLDHLGQPGQALHCFDTYLAASPAGALAQEATFERARALRTMGNRQEEIAAWQTFLHRFPDALEAPLARQYMEQTP